MSAQESRQRPRPSEVEAKVFEVLRRECRVARPIERSTRLAEDLELDSVGLLTLSLEVENHYKLVLGEDPENPPRTVGEVIELVTRRLAEEGRGT